MLTRSLFAGVAALALLAAPGFAQKKKEEGPSAAAKAARDFNKDPYPSTYKPYPGEPTALIGATVFDGEGGRIDNGIVLFADGKVTAVGVVDVGERSDLGLT